jgi:hypothetical protein
MGPRMEQVKNGTLFYCLHLFEWYDDLTELIRQYAICGFAKFANSKEGPMAILKAVVKGYNNRLEPHSLDICLMPLRSIEPVFHFDGTPVGCIGKMRSCLPIVKGLPLFTRSNLRETRNLSLPIRRYPEYNPFLVYVFYYCCLL